MGWGDVGGQERPEGAEGGGWTAEDCAVDAVEAALGGGSPPEGHMPVGAVAAADYGGDLT